MQADIGRAAVQAVVFGDRDLKRYLLAEPQRAAEADHDARIGKCRYVRCAIGRGMGIELHRQAQMVEGPPDTPRCPKAINRPPRSERPLGASPASAPRLALYNQLRVPVDPGSAPEVSAQSEAEYPPEPASALSSPVGSLTLPRIARPSFDNGQCGTA